MAEDAALADRAREVGRAQIFVAGREIVGLAAAIVGKLRLKEMVAEIDQIAAGVIAGTDYIVDAVVGGVAGGFEALIVTGGRGKAVILPSEMFTVPCGSCCAWRRE